MEALPIIMTTAYICMGVYNGVKTCTAMYQDAKKVKGYMANRFKSNDHKPNDNIKIETELEEIYSDDSDSFVLLDIDVDNNVNKNGNKPEDKPDKLVSFEMFTML